MAGDSTFTRDVVVNLESGLHLGPCAQIVQAAQRFGCQLQIRKGDRAVNAKSMLDLLTLVAEHGTVLTLEADGDGADEAIAAVVVLFERNFVVE